MSEEPEHRDDRPPEDLEPGEEDLAEVRGGASPMPGGPVPIPYPNLPGPPRTR